MTDARTPEPSHLPEPDRVRWTALRAGIRNVWEYDARTFVFQRGRLLLRGRNEAGKTKALELLFPFLLDADLSPQRLDPFGSSARQMRWNLLNDDNPEAQHRLGYLWLELGRRGGDGPEYVTLGAGLKARRSASDVEAWFFLSSRRPGAGLDLVAEDGRPLTRGQLAEALGANGQVFERHADYRRAVNARLFGMPDEQYAALVDTLLHLRRPQLSKTLDVDRLSGFLSDSLPPLDPAVIAPIAEGFERLDHRRSDLENLRAVLGTLRAFDEVYRDYACAVAKGRAIAVTRAESAYQKARGEAKARAEERDALAARRSALEHRLAELDAAERELAARVRALESSDAYRSARDLADAEAEARAAEARSAAVGSRQEEDAASRHRAEARREAAEREAEARRAEVERERSAASARAAEAHLAAGHVSIDALAARGEADGAAAALEAVRSERAGVLARLRGLSRELSRAEEAHRRAEERARERAEAAEAAREALVLAETSAADARARFEAAALAWTGSLEVLPADGLLVDEAEPDAFAQAVAARAEPLRQALAGERAGALHELEALRRERDALEADRDALARAPHPAPAPPPWRPSRPPDRPGAPLYLLCDFGEGARGREAPIEAALEAAGLLDAWVEPSGVVLDPHTPDAILRPAPAGGRTLADVLVPVAAGGVSAEAARAALATVAFADAGAEGEGPTWISADGRFQVGALSGAHAKAAVGFVGATAREAERARRMAELAARIDALAEALGAAEARAAAAGERQDRLARELASLPSATELAEARARVVVRAEALRDAREELQAAVRAAGEAGLGLRRAAAALDSAAAEAGLAAFARDPEAIADRTRAWESAAERLLSAARASAQASAASARERSAAREAAARAERSAGEALRAREAAATARARAEAFRAAAGAEADDVVRQIAGAQGEAERVRAERTATTAEERRLAEAVGAATVSAAEAERAVAARDEERKDAATALRAIAEDGLVHAAGLRSGAEPRGEEPPGQSVGAETSPVPAETPPAEWSFSATLDVARRIDASVERGATPEERDRAEDRLMRRQTELQAQLPPDVRILPSRPRGVLTYAFAWKGRTGPAREVLSEIDAQVQARQALLADEERRLIEEFLSGEAHDHLAGRLRQARALVDRMNAALEERATASGTRIKLAWEVDPEHAGARDAVALFLKAGHLLSAANRDALRLFLHDRLSRAREAEGPTPLQERMLEALDYRPWHRFIVQHREPGRDWAPLTKKAHAAGSGGKKAVLLHLPLFAAAAAFFDSAALPGAPRIIALDEAFAGIDRPMRGQLMGLLAEFDLDFVMTSYEEWGFYEELDGLSAYHLSREAGVRGVHAEWFVWNGRERVLVEDS